MNTVNLTGKGGKSNVECFLKSNLELKTVDAVLRQDTELNPGDTVLLLRGEGAGCVIIEKIVGQILERRPSKGDWSKHVAPKDWVRFECVGL